MPIYTVHEAKPHLSKLIERAERGEEVIIARGDKPVARLEVIETRKVRKPGMLKGLIPEIPDSAFFDPLPDEELAVFEKGHEGDPLNERKLSTTDGHSS